MVSELLKCTADQLEPGCLDRALRAAIRNDNHFNVGKLVMKGARYDRDCLKDAGKEKKPNALAMLLLIEAACTGQVDIVRKLFGEQATVGQQDHIDDEGDGFKDARSAVMSGSISTVVPIEIARRNGQNEVRKELLIRTDVNKEEGYVHWHGLRLCELDVAWLKEIQWVKKLRLARNGFRSLPDEMETYLKQVSDVVGYQGHAIGHAS